MGIVGNSVGQREFYPEDAPFFLPTRSYYTPLAVQAYPQNFSHQPVFTKHASTQLRNPPFRPVMPFKRLSPTRSLILTSRSRILCE